MKTESLKVLIIEDEPFAQEELIRLLSNTGFNINVIECIDSIEDAIEWFVANPAPDIVFLDIQLSDGLSFQIFEKVKIMAPVIFTTAYDQYAIKAFQLNSIDYLLKPVDPKLLNRALEKFVELKGQNRSETGNVSEEQIARLLDITQKGSKYKSRFLVKIGDQIKYVIADDIAYFHAEDNVVFLTTNTSDNYIIDYSLNQLEAFLEPSKFFRLSRNYYANIHAIKKIHKFYNSRLKIDLEPTPKDEVLVSRVRVGEFLKWIES